MANCQLPERVPVSEALLLEPLPQAQSMSVHANSNVIARNVVVIFRHWRDGNPNAVLRLRSMLFEFLKINKRTRVGIRGSPTYTTCYWHIKNNLER